jgi:hypothetical protein
MFRRITVALVATAILALGGTAAHATDAPPPGQCVPTEGSEAVPAQYAVEAQFLRTVAVPAIGEPTVPNPLYVAPQAEVPATYATEYQFVHFLDVLRLAPRWHEDPKWNPGKGWVATGLTRSGPGVTREVSPYTPPVQEQGTPTIRNLDYQPPTTRTEEAWVETPGAPEGEGWAASGLTRSGEGITRQTAAPVAPVEANDCTTATVQWLTPEGSTEGNVGWPQPRWDGQCTEGTSRLVQEDDYRTGTAAERATYDSLGDVLEQGEDSAIYITHRWLWTEVCPVVTPEDPEPQEPPVVAPPAVKPPTQDPPVVVTPPVVADPIALDVTVALPEQDELDARDDYTPGPEPVLAETGAGDYLALAGLGALFLVGVGMLLRRVSRS